MCPESPASSLSQPQFVLWNLGQSVEHRMLDAVAIAPLGSKEWASNKPEPATWPWILFLGGVHGDEKEGVWLLERMREKWTRHFPYKNVGAVLWAQVNPDGVHRLARWNANNIDLNRNLPTKDWTPEIKNPRYPPGSAPASEPENKALVALIEKVKPIAILSAHSFSQYQVNVNGPAMEWGSSLAAVCKYPVTEDIGYPTPGSLGTYAGKERQIPTITLEIERDLPRERVLALHEAVMEEALRFWNERGQ